MADKKKITLTWGKRLLLVLVIMLALTYGMLSVIEKMEDPVRKGSQDYLTQAFGGNPAEITEMSLHEIVPDLMFRFEKIDVRDKNNRDKVLVHADRLFYAMPGWRFFLGMRDYLGFEIHGLQMATGFMTPKKVDLRFAGISDPAPDKEKANLILDGLYGGQDLLATAEIKRSVTGKHYMYSFYPAFPVTFKLGALEASGIFERGVNSVIFKQVQIVRGDDRAEFVLKDLKAEPLSGHAEGTINGVDFNGELKKTGDDIAFEITPSAATPDQEKQIAQFLKNIETDLGLGNAPADHIKLTLAKPANGNQTDKK